MPPSNQQFAADLRAATATLAAALEQLQWLRHYALLVLADPRSPLDLIEAIDRSLVGLRVTVLQLDNIVANALASYADRFGREYQPTNFQLN